MKQSDLGLPCLSRHFWQVTSVRNLRTFTVPLRKCKIFEQDHEILVLNSLPTSIVC